MPRPRRSTKSFTRKAPPPKPAGVPWLLAVSQLRREVENPGGEYRLAILHAVRHWREIVSLWVATAGFLSNDPPSAEMPPGLVSFEDRLVWTWNQVEPFLDGIVQTIDERSTLSSYEVVSTFETLRSGSVIFADGTAHKGVLRLAGLEVAAREADHQYRIARALNALRGNAPPPAPLATLPGAITPNQSGVP